MIFSSMLCRSSSGFRKFSGMSRYPLFILRFVFPLVMALSVIRFKASPYPLCYLQTFVILLLELPIKLIMCCKNHCLSLYSVSFSLWLAVCQDMLLVSLLFFFIAFEVMFVSEKSLKTPKG